MMRHRLAIRILGALDIAQGRADVAHPAVGGDGLDGDLGRGVLRGDLLVERQCCLEQGIRQAEAPPGSRGNHDSAELRQRSRARCASARLAWARLSSSSRAWETSAVRFIADQTVTVVIERQTRARTSKSPPESTSPRCRRDHLAARSARDGRRTRIGWPAGEPLQVLGEFQGR